MAEYMTYERMMYLAKKMGLKVETPTKNSPYYVYSASGYSPLYIDETLGYPTELKVGQWGTSESGDYGWRYNNDDYAYFVYRSNSGYPYGLRLDKESLQRAIAQYPDVPPIPFFVGTKRVNKAICKVGGGTQNRAEYLYQAEWPNQKAYVTIVRRQDE
ncbi:hypothetical protein K5I04_04950 [Murdochiella sp. Marseille-P8839]|nr:hypothetical protein [Murdochiella sp. Marseille-P8839]